MSICWASSLHWTHVLPPGGHPDVCLPPGGQGEVIQGRARAQRCMVGGVGGGRTGAQLHQILSPVLACNSAPAPELPQNQVSLLLLLHGERGWKSLLSRKCGRCLGCDGCRSNYFLGSSELACNPMHKLPGWTRHDVLPHRLEIQYIMLLAGTKSFSWLALNLGIFLPVLWSGLVHKLTVTHLAIVELGARDSGFL